MLIYQPKFVGKNRKLVKFWNLVITVAAIAPQVDSIRLQFHFTRHPELDATFFRQEMVHTLDAVGILGFLVERLKHPRRQSISLMFQNTTHVYPEILERMRIGADKIRPLTIVGVGTPAGLASYCSRTRNYRLKSQ